MSSRTPPSTLTQQFNRWLEEKEHERLEFKEAKGSFSKEKLVQYCIK